MHRAARDASEGLGVAQHIVILEEGVASFTVDHLERYADYLRGRRALPGRRGFDRDALSPFSQHAYLRPLDQFGDWMAWEGWVAWDPFCET